MLARDTRAAGLRFSHPALLRALAEVKKGRLALVDTITQHR